MAYELENQDLNTFVQGISDRKDGENPLLLAAELGCHKILKLIVGLGDEIATQGFTFDACNQNEENILHLGSY